MTVSVTSEGTVSASSYGVTVDSEGTVDTSGLVDKVMSFLDSNAPDFVQKALGVAATVGETDAEVQGALYSASTALSTTLGASLGLDVAAVGAFGLVAGVVMAIPALLLGLDSASGGTGCCGTAPYGLSNGKIDPKLARMQAIAELHLQHALSKTYVPSESEIQTLLKYSGQNADGPPCSPSEYSWESINGNYRAAQAGSAEAFIDSFIRAQFDASTGCWSYMTPPEYIVALAAAVGIWNRSHSSQRTFQGPGGRPVTIGPSTIFRMVNVSKEESYAGQSEDNPGEPEDSEPLSVALNMAAQTWKLDSQKNFVGTFIAKPGASAAIVVNEGPAIPPLPAVVNLKGLRMAPPKASPASLRTATPLPVSWSQAGKWSTALASARKVTPVVDRWYDKKQALLAGATPKQAATGGAVIGAVTWLLKAVLG